MRRLPACPPACLPARAPKGLSRSCNYCYCLRVARGKGGGAASRCGASRRRRRRRCGESVRSLAAIVISLTAKLTEPTNATPPWPTGKLGGALPDLRPMSWPAQVNAPWRLSPLSPPPPPLAKVHIRRPFRRKLAAQVSKGDGNYLRCHRRVALVGLKYVSKYK